VSVKYAGCLKIAPSYGIEEYILVDSRSVKMEVYRKEQGKWVYTAFGPADQLELTSLGLHFPLADAYVNTDFEIES
jgi:Uma2 family endonuclease